MTTRKSFGLGKRSSHFFKSKSSDDLNESTESSAKSGGTGSGGSGDDNDDMTKSKQEQEEYDLANSEVEKILGTTKPKHLGEGLQSGLGYILRGAVGACGAVVLMPTVAGAEGHKEAGIIGGIAGASSGVVCGLVQGANVLGGGVITGVSQIVQGATATPNAVIAPSRGFWWNGATGKWEQVR
ncbi:MAG: hypothetical protein ACI8RD_010299 [Bacillariaceae sp.]|jgi:hypothetical protein